MYSSKSIVNLEQYYSSKSKKYLSLKLLLKVQFIQKVTQVNVTNYYPPLDMRIPGSVPESRFNETSECVHPEMRETLGFQF